MGNPINHNLQSGQLVSLPTLPTTINVINAASQTGVATFTQQQAIFVTGRNTFIALAGTTLPANARLANVNGTFVQSGLPIMVWNRGYNGFVSPEDIGGIASGLPGTAVYINTNHCETDDCVTELRHPALQCIGSRHQVLHPVFQRDLDRQPAVRMARPARHDRRVFEGHGRHAANGHSP